MVSGQLHTSVVEYLSAGADELQHPAVADAPEAGGTGVQTGIPVIYAVHIRLDLAKIGMQECSKGNCCGIGAATAQCCDVVIVVDALKTCHNHHIS